MERVKAMVIRARGSDDNIIKSLKRQKPAALLLLQEVMITLSMMFNLYGVLSPRMRKMWQNANHEADPSSLCSSKSTLDQTAGKGNW
nr:hypothetical protein Iba_scaffold22629CG0010 [Ipomoea batatas]